MCVGVWIHHPKKLILNWMNSTPFVIFFLSLRNAHEFGVLEHQNIFLAFCASAQQTFKSFSIENGWLNVYEKIWSKMKFCRRKIGLEWMLFVLTWLWQQTFQLELEFVFKIKGPATAGWFSEFHQTRAPKTPPALAKKASKQIWNLNLRQRTVICWS